MVIEFQKRGLVHSHIIFIQDEASKNSLRDPIHVDEIISAEIPDNSNSALRDAVIKNMIHLPRKDNPGPVFMQE